MGCPITLCLSCQYHLSEYRHAGKPTVNQLIVKHNLYSHSPVKFTYYINNLPISSSDPSVCDFGFILTPSVCPPPKHIEISYCKALRLLGFIIRTSQQFRLHLRSNLSFVPLFVLSWNIGL